MPIVIKFLLNIFLFFVYLLVSIVLGNFLYWLVLNNTWKIVPGPNDPIHMKIALVVFIAVLFFTFILIKYFYLNIKTKKEEIEIDTIEEIHEYEKEPQFEEKIDSKIIEPEKIDLQSVKPLKTETKKQIKKVKETESNSDTMEIFMGKEIK